MRSKEMPSVTVIGSLNTDVVTVTPRVPEGGETLQATSFSIGCGGKGANQAVAAARCTRNDPSKGNDAASPAASTVTVRMVGAVGGDTFGETLKKSLEADGVNCNLVKTFPKETTGTATIIVEESSGENRILYVPGANHALTAENSSIDASEYGNVTLFQLETPHEVVSCIADTERTASLSRYKAFHHIRAAKAAGAMVILNPSPVADLPTDVLSMIDYLVLNEGEAAALMSQDPAEVKDLGALYYTLHDQGVENILMTLGARGCFVSLSQAETFQGTLVAQKVKAVDTTAAGDTFAGAFAAQLACIPSDQFKVTNDSDRRRLTARQLDAVAFAQKAAAKTVQKPGAQSSIPWLNEIEAS